MPRDLINRFKWISVGGLATLSLALGVLACLSSNHGPNNLELELEEIWKQVLPDSFDFSGVVGPPNRLVMWSHSQHFLLERNAEGEVVEIRLPGRFPPVAVALPSESQVLTLLDSANATLLRHDRRGKELSPAVGFSGIIEDGAYSRGRWYIGVTRRVTEAANSPFTIDEVNAGELRTIFSISSFGVGGPSGRGALDLTAAGDLVVSERFSPFRVFLIDSSGTVLLTFSPHVIDSSQPAINKTTWNSLVALSTLSVTPGYLQTLADPKGLTRVLVTYDKDGRPLGTRVLQMPIGFVASYPEDHLLIAYRRTDLQELVGYQWRWVPK